MAKSTGAARRRRSTFGYDGGFSRRCVGALDGFYALSVCAVAKRRLEIPLVRNSIDARAGFLESGIRRHHMENDSRSFKSRGRGLRYPDLNENHLSVERGESAAYSGCLQPRF